MTDALSKTGPRPHPKTEQPKTEARPPAAPQDSLAAAAPGQRPTPAQAAQALHKPKTKPKSTTEKTAVEQLPNLQGLADAERLNKAGMMAQDVNQRGTRTAEIHPEILTEGGSNRLTTYAMTASLGGGAQDPTLNVDRQGPVINETVNVEGHTLAPYAGMMGGSYLLGMNFSETANISTNAFLLATPGFAAPVVLQRFHVGDLSLTAGAAPIVAGGTGLKVLADKDGWVQLEQARKLVVGGLLLGGFSNGVVGASGRLTVVREREMILKRWMKPEQAAPLLKAQDKGMRSYAQNKAITLGLKKPLIQFPDLADPKSMELRDEVVCSVRGSLTATVALASSVVISGVNLSIYGEFELAVSRRKDETTDHKEALTVVVSPKKVSKSLSAFIDVAVLAELRSTVSKSDIERQCYQFQVGEPEAMTAYQNLLQGQLPGAGMQLEGVSSLDAERMVHLMAEEKLPPGVKRIFAERAEVPQATAHGGGITLPRFLPYFKLAGLSVEKRVQHARHSIADGKSGLSSESHTRVMEKQKLHYGTDTAKAFARTRQITYGKENDAVLRGITLGTKFTLDRSRKGNRNALATVLNEQLLVQPKAKSFTNQDVKSEQTYDLSAERDLTAHDLDRLVQMAAKGAVPEKASRALRTLLNHLRDLGEAASTPRATPLFGAYVRATGVGGIGALHRLLGDDSKMTVTPKSSAKKDVHDKKLELATLYTRPIEARLTSSSRLNRRIKQVEEAVKEATQAAADLRQDPLLQTFAPEKWQEEIKAIDADKAALEKLIDTQHLGKTERQILKSKLSNSANKALNTLEQTRKKGGTP